MDFYEMVAPDMAISPFIRLSRMAVTVADINGVEFIILARLNCHTDRTKDLKPGVKKYLFCHGAEKYRKELLADATLDVTHFKPDEQTIRRAIKIDRSENGPMQFNCYECHKPHKSVRPDWATASHAIKIHIYVESA
jgi:hypothetical protein